MTLPPGPPPESPADTPHQRPPAAWPPEPTPPPRGARGRRVAALAARRLGPPLLGLLVLLAGAYVLAGPGVPGLPHLATRPTATPLSLVRTGAEAVPTAAPAPTAGAAEV